MDSTAKTFALGTKLMPYLAILEHDLRALWTSRLVRLWLAATAVMTLLLAAANWAKFQDATLIASLLFPYLVFPWFFVVVVLGVSPVSGARAEVLADGILSRPVSRCEYLLAAWSARVLLVLGVYLVVTVPAVAIVTLAKRPVPEDAVTLFGIVSSLGVVALVLTFLVSLGFLAGTLLRKPLLAAVVLVFVWYPIGIVLNAFSLEEFSPISLSRAMSTQLRQPWRAADAEARGKANAQDMEALARQMDHFLSVFSNGQPSPAAKPDFFEGGRFTDFSLLRVILGYGLPTLMAVALAMVFFHRRDL
ncbi:MAG: ABC transporter permease subunit [Phycisphaerae bacterium]|nr:ABC transporter permease subunit [Phycisphaerae bacterium]